MSFIASTIYGNIMNKYQHTHVLSLTCCPGVKLKQISLISVWKTPSNNLLKETLLQKWLVLWYWLIVPWLLYTVLWMAALQ